MYRNVDAELKRNGMTRGKLAEAMHLSPSTMSLKLNGKSLITLSEALKVKEVLRVDMALEELFAQATERR